jgi:hypothetical protein
MRFIAYPLGAIMVLVILSVAAFFLYSSVVPKKSLQEFQLRETDTDGRPTVSIDGRLLGGVMAVHSVRSYQKDGSIVLVVRAGITRPGLNGATFHYDIAIPSDVNKVSFGHPNDVIWIRKP